MKRLDLALAGVAAGTLLLVNDSAQATRDVLDHLDPRVACSEDLVAGVYGFNTNGFVVDVVGDQIEFVEGARQAGTGTVDLRADGTAVFRLERFFSGIPELEGEGPFFDEFEATWHVRKDCTGTADLTEFGLDVDWIFVAVQDARELHLVSGAGTLSEVDANRVFSVPPALPDGPPPEVCDTTLLAGVYGFNFDTLADPSGGAEAGVGLLDLSKSGSLRLKLEGFSEGGTEPFMRFERGHWEVREDCTGLLELRGGDLYTFVAVNNGNELHLVMEALLEEAEAKRLVYPSSLP